MSGSPLSDEQAVDDLKRLQARLTDALAETFGPDRGAVMHELWTVEKTLGMHPEFHSQSGQDRYLHEALFENSSSGTFVDIGGYDGITGSNTLFFERQLGWKGLLLEPAARPFEAARMNRACICRQVAAGGRNATATFLEIQSGYTQMSGLEDCYDREMLRVVRRNPVHAEARVRVEVQPIGTLLREAGIDRIDYVSLDVEGSEMAVLEAFPFDRVPVTAWSIENNTGSPDIARFMASRGYAAVEFVGTDEIYCAAACWSGS